MKRKTTPGPVSISCYPEEKLIFQALCNCYGLSKTEMFRQMLNTFNLINCLPEVKKQIDDLSRTSLVNKDVS